jgi:hypothetical protein
MASPPLLNLTTIDLSRTAVTNEKILAMSALKARFRER